jgi:hypothetical protein
MKLISKIILVCTLFFAISCRKDSLESADKIQDYANKLTGSAVEFFKLRASLAKTMAKVCKDDEFRAYFKTQSTLKNNHFKEFLIVQHLSDKVKSNGTSLKQLIESSIDEEVNGLFGTNLIQKVVELDPCVVLKLPDFFRYFQWETDDLIPMVIPVTPDPEITFGQDLRYMAFFYNSKHTIIYDYMDYFHLSLKNSEDYFSD